MIFFGLELKLELFSEGTTFTHSIYFSEFLENNLTVLLKDNFHFHFRPKRSYGMGLSVCLPVCHASTAELGKPYV